MKSGWCCGHVVTYLFVIAGVPPRIFLYFCVCEYTLKFVFCMYVHVYITYVATLMSIT